MNQTQEVTGPGSAVEDPSNLIISARGISVKGPWGPAYGPIDIDVEAGGVTIIAAPSGRGRTALLLTLCGRMRPSAGSISILGYEDDARAAFKNSSVAALPEVDKVVQSISVGDLITEQRRWDKPWWHLVKASSPADMEAMCQPVFGPIGFPKMHEYVDKIDELKGILLRIAVANTQRKPLLVVGGLDEISSDADSELLLERLVDLGRTQTVIVADENATDENAAELRPGIRAIIPIRNVTAAELETKAKKGAVR